MNSAIVLVLLAVIWAAVLIPPWLQGRREARPTATIRSFHRQLFLLGQAAPDTGPTATVGPANFGRSAAPYGAVRFVGEDRGHVLLHDERRDGAAPRRRFGAGEHLGYDAGDDEDDGFDEAYADEFEAAEWDGHGGDGRLATVPAYGPAAVHGSAAGYGADEAHDVEDLGYDPREYEVLKAAGLAATYGLPAASAQRWAQRAPRHPAANGAGRVGARPRAARGRTEAYRRRRRVLAVLVATVAITLVWALVLQVAAAWAIHGVADVLLVSYLGLLVRRGRRAAEQADKVRYLAPIEAPRPAVVVLHGGAAR